MTRSAARTRTGLRVTVTDARGRAVAGGGALAAWLPKAAPRRSRGTVAIAIVSDSTMRRLNRAHRGVDKVTDVLSFPAGPSPVGRRARRTLGAGGSFSEGGGPQVLGDIAIARGVAARQARDLGHALATELRILALHGLLHLIGYDHEGDHGQMERVEERLRRRAGLPAGLIVRATRSNRPRP